MDVLEVIKILDAPLSTGVMIVVLWLFRQDALKREEVLNAMLRDCLSNGFSDENGKAQPGG